jgi:hypothetical protein
VNIVLEESDKGQFFGMEEFQFSMESCGRCTKTFMHGPTGFVSNIVGPLRVIRYTR